MKILFINLKDVVGGAVVALARLADEMQKHDDIQMQFLVGRKTSNKANIIPTRTRLQRILEERLIDPVLSTLGLQYHWFPFSSRNILKEAKRYNPDVINIHLTHGAYFQTSLLAPLSKIAPIVWTLHDMWSFTGNAAHTFGDESWKQLLNSAHLTKIYPSIGINRGSWLLRRKKWIYQKSDLTVVAPSRWLAQLARQSPVFHGKEIIHINNGIDLSKFQPIEKTKVRENLGVPGEAKVLMFSAAYLKGDMWKGGDHLMEILRRINESISYKVHLLMIGNGTNEELAAFQNFEIHETGYVDNELRMAQYFASADLVIYPTKADTLPNVLIEAIACGTPCVTFAIGGCPEIIINNENGIVIDPFDFDAMAKAIVAALDQPHELERMSKNAREHAVKTFSIQEMTRHYIQVFSEIIDSRHDKKNP